LDLQGQATRVDSTEIVQQAEEAVRELLLKALLSVDRFGPMDAVLRMYLTQPHMADHSNCKAGTGTTADQLNHPLPVGSL
jgi:hypothetical protein